MAYILRVIDSTIRISLITFCIIFFVVLLLFTVNSPLIAQESAVRGFVYEKKAGAPVPYINVYLQKTQYGTLTDDKGYFIISKIPAGNYTLIVSGIGYDTVKMAIKFGAEEIITKKLYLNESAVQLSTVSISAQREQAKTETNVAIQKITPKQIYQLPSMGSQPDLAQYLQVLPGVISTGDQGGQLYIAGGSPVENEVLLDGMIIYNPFHSIGLFSVFDTDILQSADVYTAGFGAEYGDRISSVMDIKTRAGNKKRFTGKAEVTTFGSKLLLEGPIKKQKDSTSGNSSFILSAKNSYLSQTSKDIYSNKYINVGPDGLPFDYDDLYAKMTFESGNGSQFNIFGFDYNDRVNNYEALSNFNWTNYGGGFNFSVIPGSAPMLMEGVFAYSDYNVTLDEADNLPRNSEIGGFNLGLHFTYFLGKDAVKYGIELLGFKTDFNFSNSIGEAIDQTANSTEFGAYVKYKYNVGDFIIEPSFRIHYYASLSAISPEPRLAVKYKLTDKLRLKLAGGLYAQNLISATYNEDVVNLFYGFVSTPQSIPNSFDGTTINNNLQKAEHAVIGAEYDLTNDIDVNLEAYYKNFSRLIALNENKIYNETDPQAATAPQDLVTDFVFESGYAEGVDLTVKYEHKQLYFWGVYSYGNVKMFDGTNYYNPYYDRKQNLNLVASYKFGKALSWELGARWNIGSGFPFTQTQGVYEKLPMNDGVNTNIINTNGVLSFVYAPYDAARLPWYHRLDLSLKKRFYVGKYTNLDLNFSVINVYNRKNIFYVNRVTDQVVYQLPIMPTLGISMTF